MMAMVSRSRSSISRVVNARPGTPAWRGPGDEFPGLQATVHLTPQVSQGHLPHRQFQGIAEQLPLAHDGLPLKASALGVGHGHARRHARDVWLET